MSKVTKNKRCPLQKECGRKCEHEGAELNCDYYKNNGIGESAIDDQEVIRTQLAALKARFEDEALIEQLSIGDEESSIVYIPIEKLYPHPDNPRKDLGDLTELAESIKEKGVLQNLTVVKGHYLTLEEYIAMCKSEGVTKEVAKNMYSRENAYVDEDYTIIIGHRRCGASRIAGLSKLPCVITEMTEREQVATMLLENMQRSDLTVYEQARGFQMMMDLGSSIDDISQKTGFSKKTVKGRLKIAELDPEKLRRVSAERQLSIGDFDKINQIDDIDKRNELLSTVGTNNFDYNYNRILKEQKLERARPFVEGAVRALKGRKIQHSETYGGKYTQILEVSLEKLIAGEAIEIPKKYEEEKLFYYVNDYSLELRLYILTPKAPPVRRSKAEIDRERRIKDAHAILEALAASAYELRYNFVKDLRVTKANEDAIRAGAFQALIMEQEYYITHENQSDVYEGTGVVEGLKGCYYADERAGKKLEGFRKDPKRLYPSIIYVSFGDSAKNVFNTTYKNEYPKHQENGKLRLLYKWLCSCGYEMSDAERSWMDGTLDVFEEGGEKK